MGSKCPICVLRCPINLKICAHVGCHSGDLVRVSPSVISDPLGGAALSCDQTAASGANAADVVPTPMVIGPGRKGLPAFGFGGETAVRPLFYVFRCNRISV